MRDIPTNEYDTFLDLVHKAHEREGSYLSSRTRWELELVADEIRFPYDKKEGIDWGGEMVELLT